MRGTTREHESERMQECIDNCSNCHAACLETVVYCLQKGGHHAEEGHVRLLLDCAEICQTSANFMLRNSPLHAITCAACSALPAPSSYRSAATWRNWASAPILRRVPRKARWRPRR